MGNHSNATVKDMANLEFMRSMSPTLAYLILLMVLGLVGNTLVFIVYYRRFKPSTTRMYVLAMSVCDIFNNLLALPSDIFETRFHYDFESVAACKFFGYITRFLALYGGCILVAVALDRHRKICHPTKKQKSVRYVYIELASLAVFTLCLSVPFAVLRGLQTVRVKGREDVIGSSCSITDVHVKSALFVGYNVSMMVALIITFALLSVAYGLIARHVWRHRKLQKARRDTETGRHGRQTCIRLEISSGDHVQSDEESSLHTSQLSINDSGTFLGTELSECEKSDKDRPAVVKNEQKTVEALQTDQKLNDAVHSEQKTTGACHGQKTTGSAWNELKISAEVQNEQMTTTAFEEEQETALQAHDGQKITAEAKNGQKTADEFHDEQKIASEFHREQETPSNLSDTQKAEDKFENEQKINDSPHCKDETVTSTQTQRAYDFHHQQKPVTSEETQEGTVSCGDQKTVVSADSVAVLIAEEVNLSSIQNTKPEMGDSEDSCNREQGRTANTSAELKETDAGMAETKRDPQKPTSKNFEKAKMKTLSLNTMKLNAHRNFSKNRTWTKAASTKSKSSKASKKITRRTTLMMFVLTATFIVSYLPYIVMAALHKGKDRLDVGIWLLNAEQIALRSFFLNSAVNPFIYGFCCGRFRQELRSLLCSISEYLD